MTWLNNATVTTAEDKAKQAEEHEKSLQRKLLTDTDWYVIREMETGNPMPKDVRNARAEARKRIGNSSRGRTNDQ